MSLFDGLIKSTDFETEILRASDLAPTPPRSRSPRPNAGGPPAPQADLLLFTLWTLKKRKWTVLGFFLLVVLLVAAASFVMKPKYEAVARIVFNRENANPLGFKNMGEESPQDDEYSVSLDTQLQVLQSDTLGLQVIQELHLNRRPEFTGRGAAEAATNDISELSTRQRQKLLRSFRNGLSVSKEKNTRVIEIRYKSKDPKLSADVANAVTRAYIEHNFKMRFDSTMQTSNWLTQQLAELATKVQDSQQKVLDYQKEHGFIEIDGRQNSATTRLEDLNKELTAAQSDRINREAAYRLTLAENPELTAKAERDALIEKLHAQEADLKTQYAQATVQLGPSNPKVQELSNQLKETQREITAELRKMSDRVRSQYFEALAREKMIRAAVEEQKQQANKLNESAIEYSLLKRDAESNRQLYEGLLQKLKEAGVSAGLRSSNIQVVDVAQVPAVPSEPNIPLNLLMAAVLGLGGGIGLALIQERFNRTVRSPHHIQVLSSFPQLGIIPLESKVGPQMSVAQRLSLSSGQSCTDPSDLIVSSNPMSPIAECYRGLVNSLLLSAAVPPKTILVTSAITGEGKTTTSVNLAIILARQGRRVLLVDADLRRPCIHKIMRVAATDGLSTVLRIRQSLQTRASTLPFTPEGAIHRIPGIPKLSVMPAGPMDTEPAELIASDAMQDLLHEWNLQFDHVIIDSPPVLVVSDAVRLSVGADSVIVVVRSGYTPQDAFSRAQELLLQVNAAVMGVVLNAADLASPELSYYSQYGYYSSSSQLRKG